MIRAGYASDKDNALVLYKQVDNGQLTAGIVLAGFGTLQTPGQICDNAVQRAVQYAACNLQKVMDALLDKKCTQMDVASEIITRHIKLIHNGIRYFSAHVGQGIYLAGCICYVAGEDFICLPFGGGSTHICNGTHNRPLVNLAIPADADTKYIWDAIGGPAEWSGAFEVGTLPVGAQLICATQPPAEELLNTAMGALTHTNQAVVAETIYNGIMRAELPLAVLDLAQMANISTEGVDPYDEQTAS